MSERNQGIADEGWAFRHKVIAYVVFAVLFWIPFWLFVRVLQFNQQTALIAASIGAVVLLLIFAPAFQRFVGGISSMKIGPLEFAFREAVEAPGNEGEFVGAGALIDGREIVYPKASLGTFSTWVQDRIGDPARRVVMTVDVSYEAHVYLPMLYFQAMIMAELFDLRAFLFLDSTLEREDAQILGTAPASAGLQALDDYIVQIIGQKQGADFKSGKCIRVMFKTEWHRVAPEIPKGGLAMLVGEVWRRFLEALGLVASDIDLGMNPGRFRSVFKDQLEKNLLNYPLDPDGLVRFIGYLSPGYHHVVLVDRQGSRHVRTIDRIAREIARKAFSSSLRSRQTGIQSGMG
jgi:hypothetical protein